jgi:uncharacterized protein (DUF2236 family)
VEQVADRFDARRLTSAEREDLYLDGVEWYRRYGVSMGPVPADRAAFGPVWDRYLVEELEANRAIDMALHDRTSEVKFLPRWTRLLQPVVVAPVLHLTAIGGLPPVVRERFDIPWRIDEEVEYRVLQLAVREMWRKLPASLRYGPTAADGYRARLRLERRALPGVEGAA